jgi:hypothetical protein
MNVILFNLFDLPDYIRTCIKQILFTNPECTIYLITDKNIVNEKVKCLNINTFSTTNDLFNNFKFFRNNTVKHHFELFTSSAFRFLFIEELCRNYKLENIFTFDNDVLIYGKLEDFLAKIDPEYEVAITQSVKHEYICGFNYYKNYNSLVPIAGDFKALLNFNENTLKEMFGKKFKASFVSEMSLLYYILEQRKINTLILPSFPEKNNFNCIFDPITYGQTLGGRSPALISNEESFIDTNHLLGENLINQDIQVKFENKAPYVLNKKTNECMPLFNLHVHSKKLDKFKSYE